MREKRKKKRVSKGNLVDMKVWRLCSGRWVEVKGDECGIGRKGVLIYLP